MLQRLGETYPETLHLKYPKPGYAGPSISLHVWGGVGGREDNTVRMRLEELPHSYYLYEVDWYDAESVLVRVMNRQQTTADMGVCSVATGACRCATESPPPDTRARTHAHTHHRRRHHHHPAPTARHTR